MGTFFLHSRYNLAAILIPIPLIDSIIKRWFDRLTTNGGNVPHSRFDLSPSKSANVTFSNRIGITREAPICEPNIGMYVVYERSFA